VQIQTNADLGPDPVARRAVAGNARLAIFGGGAQAARLRDGEASRIRIAQLCK
jgi:hypothetical protein